MKKLYVWFDRHMKTRIALQLVMDGLPFVLLMGFIACALNVFSYDLSLEWLMHVGIYGFFILTLPSFILGIWLRGRAEAEFACYPWCVKVSTILRILGALAVSFSVFLGFLAILAFVSA